jgi:1-deoxy-D-xylulose-5-phosphate reductoisomerase
VSDPRSVVVLGSSGSIGRQALEVIGHRRDQYRVTGLAVRNNWQLVVQQALDSNAEVVALEDGAAADRAARELAAAGRQVRVLSGLGAASEVAAWPGTEIVVAAMMGSAGLGPVLSALSTGCRVALANKETLVAAGELVMRCCREAGAELIPVDGEHSAMFQLLQGVPSADVDRLMITASGGPFLGWSSERLRTVTPEMATAHPTWRMGAKISVDSATLMNKGLEVIEASWLFGVEVHRIEVVIHPQSLVHAAVALRDGGILAHLAPRDMRLPIALALSWPRREPGVWGRLEMHRLGGLTFEEPDRRTFPCLDLAYSAAATGGTLPAVMSAADEVAVDAFLDNRIPFTVISEVIVRTMERHVPWAANSIEEIMAADRWARENASAILLKVGR